MSKTISFVASDELAEFLEQESERRMTTISSTAQMLLAEKAREMGGVGQPEGDKPDSGGGDENSDDALDRHPNVWYHPDSEKHEYAVRPPGFREPGEPEESTKYYKTRDGAATRIRRWYEGEEGADARM